MIVISIILIIILALLGLPLFLVLSTASLLGYFASGQDLALYFASNFGPVATNPVFMAIPLFTLAGYLMAESKTPERLVRLSHALVGWLPGGLAVVAMFACAAFTAFTGASGVTIVALGGLLLPALLKGGYEERFSLGLLTTGGSRGILFPPSLPVIVYAMIAGLCMESIQRMECKEKTEKVEVAPKTDAQRSLEAEIDKILEEGDQEAEQDVLKEMGLGDAESEVKALIKEEEGGVARETKKSAEEEQLNLVSVDKLFVAGAIPGLLSLVLVSIYAGIVSRRMKIKREDRKTDIKEVFSAIKSAAWEIPIPLILIIGIYGGFFTAMDAAGLIAVYVFIVEVLIYRDIPFSRIPKVFRESMILVGAILLIMMSAFALTNFFIDREVPQTLFKMVRSTISSPLTFLIVLNLFLLVVGCLMDIYSAILVVVPIIIPVAWCYKIDPVHLGVVFLTNLEIGFSTPPFGVNLFVGSLAFRRPVVDLVRAVLPFLGISLVSLILVTYWQDLSLFLVRLTGVK